MAPPPKPHMKDLDDTERVNLSEALDLSEMAKEAKTHGDFNVADGVPLPRANEIETPELAADWAQREIVKATPRAVQELIHQMKRGGVPKDRLAAALQILDRAGVQAKQETRHNAPVIILTPKVIASLPWLKEAKAKGQIVDGQLVKGAAGATTSD